MSDIQGPNGKFKRGDRIYALVNEPSPSAMFGTDAFYEAKVTGIAKIRTVYGLREAEQVFHYHVKFYDRCDKSIKEKSQGMFTGKSFVVSELDLFPSRLDALAFQKGNSAYRQTRKGWDEYEWVPKKSR